MSLNKLEIIKGDDVSLTSTFTDGDGAVVDISGSSITFTAKNDFGSAAVITKTVTSHSDPTNGVTIIALTDTDTAVDAGDYFYDIQITFSDGKVNSISYGKLIVKQDVTN